jgi:hypothetical protein
MNNFIDGAIMMGFCVAGLCFLKFWRRSRDRFFLWFSLAFWIMAVNRLFLMILSPDRRVPSEDHAILYVVRLVAFSILLLAIVEKNRKPRAEATTPVERGPSSEA